MVGKTGAVCIKDPGADLTTETGVACITEAGGKDVTGVVCMTETGGRGSEGKFGRMPGVLRVEFSNEA